MGAEERGADIQADDNGTEEEDGLLWKSSAAAGSEEKHGDALRGSEVHPCRASALWLGQLSRNACSDSPATNNASSTLSTATQSTSKVPCPRLSMHTRLLGNSACQLSRCHLGATATTSTAMAPAPASQKASCGQVGARLLRRVGQWEHPPYVIGYAAQQYLRARTMLCDVGQTPGGVRKTYP